MGRYLKNETQHSDKSEEYKDTPSVQLAAVTGDAAEEEEDDMLPNYYRVMDGVPELPWRISWRQDSEEADTLDDNL